MPQSTAQRLQPDEDRQPSTDGSKKPVDKFRDGPVHVSIWQNNGAKGLFLSASIELRYKNSNEEWQTGHSYTSSDLGHLESAARKARSRMDILRPRHTAKPAPTP